MNRAWRATIIATAFATVVPDLTLAQSDDRSYVVNTESSTVGFTVSARALFTFKRQGRFTEFSGSVAYDPVRPSDTRVDLTVLTASVDTAKPEENVLLRSGDFFDVDHYPTMKFVSTGATMQPDGVLAMAGDLTIRGVTKRVVIPVHVVPSGQLEGQPAARFETHFDIDRTDFGLSGPRSSGGFKVSIGRNVQIHLAIAASMLGAHVRR
jgi:polyisoprenoid-binding protein YceI